MVRYIPETQKRRSLVLLVIVNMETYIPRAYNKKLLNKRHSYFEAYVAYASI